MRFVVGDTVSDTSKNGELPSKLRDVPFPPNKEGLDQSFEFQRKNGQWKIDGVSWADGPEARVMAKPKRGSVERWKLKNGSGGWVSTLSFSSLLLEEFWGRQRFCSHFSLHAPLGLAILGIPDLSKLNQIMLTHE
jgi:hypothetical protein